MPGDVGEFLLDVDADGSWKIHVGQPIAPPKEIRTFPVAASGDGPAVVGQLEVEGGAMVSGQHEGESNFIVQANNEGDYQVTDTELLFNEIGTFEGETRMQKEDFLWFSVAADDAWRPGIEE